MALDQTRPDTAKISSEVRFILIDKAEAALGALKYLRQRAVAYASPDSVAELALHIPLPRPSSNEVEDLTCLWEKRDGGFLPEVVRPESPSLMDMIFGDSTHADEEMECAHDVHDSWFKVLCDASDSSDPFQHLEFLSATLPSDSNTSSFGHEAQPHDQCQGGNSCGDCMEWDSSDSETSQLGLDNKALDLTGNAMDKTHPLLTPWSQSFPSQLQIYLDQLDAFACGEFRTNQASETSASDMPIDPRLFELQPSTTQDRVDYLHVEHSGSHPVSLDQLLELETYIQPISRFRSYLNESLIAAADKSNRREQRYRMRENDGDITCIMRSHGEGSPLAEAITADEEWPEMSEWDAQLVKACPRKKIFGKSTPDWLRSPSGLVPKTEPSTVIDPPKLAPRW
ncbi:hypothetical protein S40293_10814 [Stachybotrys chartarum IBT 40293]|nr:hypothetical protein S40293_10814 [Stachybotrys chartarum IBT 40293]